MKPTRHLLSGIAVCVCVLGVAVARRGLAALARTERQRRLARSHAADPLERDGQHRLEGADRRRRRLDADRQRRSGLRDVADRRRHQARGEPPAPGAGGRRGGAGGARAGDRRRGGRRPEQDRVRRRSLRPRRRQAHLGAPHRRGRRSDAGPRQAQPRDAEPGHRRHARLRVVRDGTDRRARSRAAPWCGSGISPPRTARSTFSGDTAARRCCTATC